MLPCVVVPRAWPVLRTPCAHACRLGWVVVMAATLAGLAPSAGAHGVSPRLASAVAGIFHPDALALSALLLLGVVGLYARGDGTSACLAAAFAVGGGPLVAPLAGACVIVVLHDRVMRPGHGTGGLLGMAMLAVMDPLTLGGTQLACVLPVAVLMASWPLLHLSWRPGGGRRHLSALRMADVAGFVVGCHLWLRMLAGYPDIPVLSERWGDGLVAIAAGLFLAAAVRALVARDVRRVLCGLFGGMAALPVLLAGLGLVARGNDLPEMLDGAVACLFLVMAAGTLTWGALLALAEAMEVEAGRLVLMHLGGMAALMPRLSALLSVALLAIGGVPPLIGFSLSWMVLRLFNALPHADSLAREIPVAAVLIVMGTGWGLRLLALGRLVGVVLCGRPRTPRGAGAADPPVGILVRCALAVAAACAISVMPGAWFRLAGVALGHVTRQGQDGAPARMSLFALPSPDGVAVMLPVRSFMLLAGIGVVVWMLWRLRGVAAARQVATWEQGAPSAPPWMPFGDPLAQVGAGVFVRLVLDMVGWPEGAQAPWKRLLRLRRLAARRMALPPGWLSDDAAARSAPMLLLAVAGVAVALLCWLS
ncbi:proton-conducting transporter transmembrane domain-containing protein [Novacetimonas pomaceti]|uniref:NADH:quinone oxidoreductase/Mrp antiporter transmembrane domain-containing protein n=1 Tax=Novacetimonas pomaceti TaxID=2021998 RepID=A0A318QVU3_9PROT|nr:proton-conducting transporter membrane subunit [Novacetimonas pomaceti]PYD76953.1 hypothetical protein CFR71_00960 [Novacetimonas pomaceti]